MLQRPGTLYSFSIEFRITRNLDKKQRHLLPALTRNWINDENPNDVDGFASFLKSSGITRGALTTSLASKILFLNNPWEIYPFDELARNAAKFKGTNYKLY